MIRMDIRAALLSLLCLALSLSTFVSLPSLAETFDRCRAIIADGSTIAIGSERIRLLDVVSLRAPAAMPTSWQKERLAQLLR